MADAGGFGAEILPGFSGGDSDGGSSASAATSALEAVAPLPSDEQLAAWVADLCTQGFDRQVVLGHGHRFRTEQVKQPQRLDGLNSLNGCSKLASVRADLASCGTF